MVEEQPAERARPVLRRVVDSWATRSLAVGGVATGLDVGVLLLALQAGAPTPIAAMLGVLVGAAFAFVANRRFAFRDEGDVLAQLSRYAVSTAGAMLLHGGLVWWLSDRVGVPVVLAKLGADFLVFTCGQLVLLRFVVFPKKKAIEAASS
jgi:putative flippase GtrA